MEWKVAMSKAGGETDTFVNIHIAFVIIHLLIWLHIPLMMTNIAHSVAMLLLTDG